MSSESVEWVNQKSEIESERLRAVKAVLLAAYNVGSFNAFPDQNFGEPSISQFLYEMNYHADRGYVEDKCAVWRESPLRFMLSLDKERLPAFIDWCLARFGGKP